MLANILSIARVGMVLLAIGLFGRGMALNITALVLVGGAFLTDALDGWVARRMGTASIIGGVLDVAADRIVEMVCWFYFAVAGLVPIWIPVIILIRGVATDTVRAAAARLGLSLSGDEPGIQSRWGRVLIGSWWSRGGYALLKVAAFLALGLLIITSDLPAEAGIGPEIERVLGTVAVSLVYLVLGFCLLRAVPVLASSRRCFIEGLAG